MNCDMSIIVEGPDERGWRVRQCSRPGCGKKTNWTPDEPGRIHFSCRAWPRASEWGTWIALFLEAIYIRKPTVAWLAWKLNLVEPSANCPLGCEAREKWLNSLGGKTVMAWRRFKERLSRLFRPTA